MATVVPPLPQEPMGAGEAFTTGLGQGLQTLLSSKLQEMQASKQQSATAKALQSLGYAPQDAHYLSALHPELLGQVLKQFMPNPEAQQQEAQQQSGMETIEQLGQPTPQEQYQQQVTTGQPVQTNNRQMLEAEQQQRRPMEQGEGPATPIENQPMKQVKPTAVASEKQALPSIKQLGQIKPTKKQPTIIARPDPKVAATINKETQDYAKKVSGDADFADFASKRLGRMEQINLTGKFSSPIWTAVAKGLGHLPFGMGIDLSATLTPDSQEFDKLSTDFLKGAKQFFGSRITDNEVRLFLKTIPSLLMSREGRQRVINNMRNINEAAVLKKNTMQDIIQENGGVRPRNIEELVDKKMKPQMDAMADKFRLGYDKTQRDTEQEQIFERAKNTVMERYKGKKPQNFGQKAMKEALPELRKLNLKYGEEDISEIQEKHQKPIDFLVWFFKDSLWQ